MKNSTAPAMRSDDEFPALLASACGVDLRAWGQVFRVTAGASRLSYKIDRWD